MQRHYSDTTPISYVPRHPSRLNPARGTVSMPTSPLLGAIREGSVWSLDPIAQIPQTALLQTFLPQTSTPHHLLSESPPALLTHIDPTPQNWFHPSSTLSSWRQEGQGDCEGEGEVEGEGQGSGHARKKRAQVRVACTHCQKACKKCSNMRPCARCVKYGLPDCVDSTRKPRKTGIKRGPYKRRSSKYASSFDYPDSLPPFAHHNQHIQSHQSPRMVTSSHLTHTYSTQNTNPFQQKQKQNQNPDQDQNQYPYFGLTQPLTQPQSTDPFPPYFPNVGATQDQNQDQPLTPPSPTSQAFQTALEAPPRWINGQRQPKARIQPRTQLHGQPSTLSLSQTRNLHLPQHQNKDQPLQLKLSPPASNLKSSPGILYPPTPIVHTFPVSLSGPGDPFSRAVSPIGHSDGNHPPRHNFSNINSDQLTKLTSKHNGSTRDAKINFNFEPKLNSNSTLSQIPNPTQGQTQPPKHTTMAHSHSHSLTRIRKPSLKTLISPASSRAPSPSPTPTPNPISTYMKEHGDTGRIVLSPTLFDQPMNLEFEEDVVGLESGSEGGFSDEGIVRARVEGGGAGGVGGGYGGGYGFGGIGADGRRESLGLGLGMMGFSGMNGFQ